MPTKPTPEPVEVDPAAAPSPAPTSEAAPEAAAPAPAPAPAPTAALLPTREFSSGALPLLSVAALLIAASVATWWYERSIEIEARILADEIAASVVPDEALVPSAVKGARAENAALAAALAARFAPRQDPVVALRVIEAAAKVAGVKTAFTQVDVAGWDGDPETLGALDLAAATGTPYAAVVAALEGDGTWAQTLALASSLESLPLAARVDALRLGARVDERGRAAWSLAAEISVIAK